MTKYRLKQTLSITLKWQKSDQILTVSLSFTAMCTVLCSNKLNKSTVCADKHVSRKAHITVTMMTKSLRLEWIYSYQGEVNPTSYENDSGRRWFACPQRQWFGWWCLYYKNLSSALYLPLSLKRPLGLIKCKYLCLSFSFYILFRCAPQFPFLFVASFGSIDVSLTF